MKKRFLLVTILFVTSFSACTIANPKIPYGVWESDNPHIIMDIARENSDVKSSKIETYKAVYTMPNGDSKTLSVLFNKIDGHIEIHDRHNEQSVPIDYYFIGTYRKSNNKLTVTLISQPMAGTDYEEIVFTKIQDYDEVTE